jgi:hypothetical protein
MLFYSMYLPWAAFRGIEFRRPLPAKGRDQNPMNPCPRPFWGRVDRVRRFHQPTRAG